MKSRMDKKYINEGIEEGRCGCTVEQKKQMIEITDSLTDELTDGRTDRRTNKRTKQ